MLTTKEMEESYMRRWRHMTGRREILAWAITRAEQLGGLSPSARNMLSTPRRAVAFWHGADLLPDSFQEGLATVVSVGQLQVQLLCYVRPSNVPGNVEACSASPYLDRDAAEAHIATHGVQFVADLVRAKALLGDATLPSPGGDMPPSRRWLVYRRRLDLVKASAVVEFCQPDRCRPLVRQLGSRKDHTRCEPGRV